jgi:glycosyltransferase involved in cell wall biosynthesis
MRVLVFGERLAPPADEGIKNLTLNLAAGLRDLGHEVRLLTTGGTTWPEMKVDDLPASRLLRSPELGLEIQHFRPDAICYVPTASLTFASGIRARTLKAYAGGAPTALIATQGRRHGRAVCLAARMARPDLCVTQSAATERQAQRLGWRTARVAPGVDLIRFRPVGADERARLRSEHRLPVDRTVVLHAGHLNRRRGVTDMAGLPSGGVVYPVLAVSTSTTQDESLSHELRAAGVRVMTEYLPNIATLYQAADVYLFPAPPDPLAPSSIDVPLSVLEAAACGLPIVTRRFGAIEELWPAEPGVVFYDRPEELPAAVAKAQQYAGATRRLAEPFGWPAMAAAIIDKLPHRGGSLCR